MAGFRVRLERMSQQAFYDWEAGKADPREKIHNGQVLFIWTMIDRWQAHKPASLLRKQ